MQYELGLGFDDDEAVEGDQVEEVSVAVKYMGKEIQFSCEEHKESFIKLTGRQKEYIAAYMLTGSPMGVARVVGVRGNPRTVGKTLSKIAKAMGLDGLKELGARKDVGSIATARSLRELIESQGYKCALSGVPLSPDTAQLDHKVPLANGGTNEIDNLQWVESQVNVAKGTMSQDDFVAMCLQVAEVHRINERRRAPSLGGKGSPGLN